MWPRSAGSILQFQIQLNCVQAPHASSLVVGTAVCGHAGHICNYTSYWSLSLRICSVGADTLQWNPMPFSFQGTGLHVKSAWRVQPPHVLVTLAPGDSCASPWAIQGPSDAHFRIFDRV